MKTIEIEDAEKIKKRCYKVEVHTTNGLRDTTSNLHGLTESERKNKREVYRDCEFGVLYVTTDDPH